MSDQSFTAGTVVQLRSGGPNLTVSSSGAYTVIIYHNPVTGMFEEFTMPSAALREANEVPQVPNNAAGLRHSSVAKASF
jgi:uncharacterized protein YodC (DUF2158 family)